MREVTRGPRVGDVDAIVGASGRASPRPIQAAMPLGKTNAPTFWGTRPAPPHRSGLPATHGLPGATTALAALDPALLSGAPPAAAGAPGCPLPPGPRALGPSRWERTPDLQRTRPALGVRPLAALRGRPRPDRRRPRRSPRTSAVRVSVRPSSRGSTPLPALAGPDAPRHRGGRSGCPDGIRAHPRRRRSRAVVFRGGDFCPFTHFPQGSTRGALG